MFTTRPIKNYKGMGGKFGAQVVDDKDDVRCVHPANTEWDALYQADKDARNRNLYESEDYLGYTIEPRYEQSWPLHDRFGFWVVKDGANVMPGACWYHTVEEARKGINALELAKGDGQLFWLLMGHAGLSTTTVQDRTTGSVTCKDAPGLRVEWDGQQIELGGMLRLRPTSALALSEMLRDAAEQALGKGY